MKKRFIFDENYIKRYAKRNKTRWLVIVMCILIVLSVIVIVLLINRGNKRKVKPSVPDFEIKEEMVLESGSALPESVDYFKKLENVDVKDIEVIYPEEFEISYDIDSCSEEELEKINNEDVNIEDYSCAVPVLKTPTTYGVTVKVLDAQYTVNLKVEDKTAPKLELKDLEVIKGEKYEIEDFVQSCKDATDSCKLEYYSLDVDDDGNPIDYGNYTEAGEYVVRIVASDDYGNTSEPLEVKLNIVEPTSDVYIVTFDSSGGSAVASAKVLKDKKVEEPKNPTKNGYIFIGWYLDDKKFDFDTPINDNIVITAKWQKSDSSQGNSGSTVPGVVNVTSISVSYQKIYLDINQSKTITAKVNPSNATNKTITWKSSNSNIAKVQNGVITGVKEGTVTITASAGGKSASVTVVVRNSGSGGQSTGCQYGNASYNGGALSVKLANGNCAVNPNGNYESKINEVVRADTIRLSSDLVRLGYNVSISQTGYSAKYEQVKNKTGIGLIGYKITVTVNVQFKKVVYVINEDGSRTFSDNPINLSK